MNNAFDLLQNMHTISIDLETTGIRPSDQVWSGGFYSTKQGTVLNKHESFFNIQDKAGTGSYTNLTSETDLISFLEKQHSSAEFGARQAGKGLTIDGKATTNVLGDWAKAVTEGKATHISDFVSNLNKELATSSTGSILLLQNVNFEDRILSKMAAEGDIPNFNSFTDNLLSKGIPASSDPRYGEPFNRHLLPKEIFDLRQNVYDSYRGLTNAFGNGEDVTGHLHQYYKDSLKVLDQYALNAQRAFTDNKTAVMDLMDFTKAIYAHGAVSGQVSTEMLSFGSKVDTLARAILGTDEIHAALADSEQQSKLFSVITEELKEIRTRGANYQSPLVDKLVKQMEKDKTYSSQLKERALNVAREHIENTGTVTKDSLTDALTNKFFSKNRHLSNVTKEDFNVSDYYQKLQAKAGEFFDESGNLKGSAEDLVKGLDDFSDTYKLEGTDKAKRVVSGKLEKILSSKATRWGAAAVGTGLITSMMFGGDREEQQRVKYDTYDEVYGNQYFGSAFADWQNRNNSHKMM